MATFKEILKSLNDFHDTLKNYPQFEKNFYELKRIIRNADSPLTIMVMGEFSTGKSTFINALLGAKVADTGATETTAIITKFYYGKKDKITAYMKDGTKKNFSSSEFVKLTSKKDNADSQFREKISYVERIFPAEILKNFTLIDSPGLGALEKDREIITQNFLSNADAVLWLVNSEQAGGKLDEVQDIEKLPQRLKPILIANKMDTLDEEEGDTPEVIIDSYRKNFKDKIRAVVGISAQAALEGKLNNNSASLKESNLQEVIDTINAIILPELDDYKIKSLLTKFGLYLHQLEESVSEIKKRIAPLQKAVPELFQKHSAAISEVRQLAEKSSKGLYDYCQKPTSCAEIDFFTGMMYHYGIILNQSMRTAHDRFNDAADENVVEAQIMLGNFENAAKSGNVYAKFKCGTKDFLKEAAEQDYADAQYLLAKQTTNIFQNLKQSWLERAATNGHALAQFELAELYKGNNDDMAFYWYSKTCNQGVLESFYELGQCYLHGRGTDIDYSSAFKYHSWAAELGKITAIFEVAVAYYEGKGKKKDRVKAFIWLESAKNKGSYNAKKFLEDNYYNNISNNAENQFLIGTAYELGKDLKQNNVLAVEWYERADNQNYLEATYRLAHYYFDLDRWNKTLPSHFYSDSNYNLWNFYGYLKKASDRNHPTSKKELNEIFNDKDGASLQYNIAKAIDSYNKDKIISFCWYLQAAKHGNAEAQNEVAMCYYYGFGVKKSTWKAFRWFRKAKANGYPINEKNYTATKAPFLALIMLLIAIGFGVAIFLASESQTKKESPKYETSRKTETPTETKPKIETPVPKPQEPKKPDLDYYAEIARSDLSIGGVSIDDDISKARQLWGTEKFVTTPKDIDRKIYHSNNLYNFEDVEIIVNNDKVVYMKTLTSKLKTKRGIHAGSTRQQVLNAYGSDPSIFTKEYILFYEYWITSPEGNRCLLRFAMRNDIVEYIGARIYVESTPQNEIKPQSSKNNDVDNAKRAFINYHKAITNKDYRTAYNILSYEQQQRIGNFNSYVAGFDNTITSEVTNLNLVYSDGNSYTFDYTLKARDHYNGGRIKVQIFQGQVTMAKEKCYWYVQYAESRIISESIE